MSDLDELSNDELIARLTARGMGEPTARFYAENRDHEDMAERIPHLLAGDS